MDKKQFLIELSELVDRLSDNQRSVLLAFGSGILAAQEAKHEKR